MAPKRIPALSIGYAVDADLAARGVVQSVFSRAVNLTVSGNLWTLLATEKRDMPFGIRVTLANFDRFGFERGDSVTVRGGYVSIGSGLVIDCRAGIRWTPASPSAIKPGLEQRLSVVSAAAHDRSWSQSPKMALEVKTALEEPATLEGAVAKVVGCGPGATPSGDDVLVGILAVLTSPCALAPAAAAAVSLSRSIAPLLATTTEISGHLLQQAAHGRFGRDIHEVVSALIENSNPHQLSENVSQLVETGATSGADMCEGLLAFAPPFFTDKMDRASA